MPVELRLVLAWVCPDCGHQNMSHGDHLISDEDVENMRKETGCEELTRGDLSAVPEEVTCAKCLSSHQTQPPGEDNT